MSDNQINPLLVTLKSRLPGGAFTIPSQGIFYTNGELSEDVKNGEIQVMPMTAMDEILIKTPDKLMSGKAIEEVFERCIPQVLKPREMLSKDVDFLLMCIRYISYGQSMNLQYKHTCENAKEHEYVIDLLPLIKATRRIDATTIDSRFSLVLPNDQVIRLRPPLFSSVLALYMSNFEQANVAGVAETDSHLKMFDVVVSTIESVDGITDKELIKEWVKQIPVGYMSQIGDIMQNVSDWGISSSVEVHCKDCKEKLQMEIPLNPVAFFF